ncbi:hypothetical protein LTQ56_17630 [Mycobacterium intracellulare subsp. intracellulare]|uniref:hypothetical protein n=1 Tax=Mycobacterium intracellulare TaxID=1767 RepID=UPI0001B4562D|nr:hypothetical protein [Mycobacterium intracellulare]UGU05756.1 hypothetical protein LTQ56_17630 [Mycobacterium intracellulare subsp. intracellulare]BCO59612.1 hypothetical protein MINTM005_48560 [Mycobacterium intracellulare]BCO96792.1 hypothetical protein MINTM016_47680 [Mycobacterium intracellulare]
MSGSPNIDIDELDRLVYDVINEAGSEERQRTALNRIIDILTEHTDFAKNVIRCSVCGGDRLSVAKVGTSPGYYQCAVCYAEDMTVDTVDNE